VTQALPRVEWVKPTHQARSQETLERILEAAEEVVSEKGLDSATVSEIVRRANSSVGAMYARFNDKDSLVTCLHERFCEQAIATTEAALDPTRWQGATIAEILTTALPFVVHVYRQKRGLIRAFFARGCSDSQFAERAARVGREISERLIALLIARRDEIKHPDPVLAVDFGLRTTFDVLDQAAIFADVQRTTVELTDEKFADELVRLFLSYLGIEPISKWERLEGQQEANGPRDE
jgi:AcrR family transcriptional regulator